MTSLVVTFAFILLTGKPNKNGVNSPACISQGSYSFSFQFVIPDKYLPASFEGRHGNIRYWARAVIDRGLGKSKMKTKPAQFFIGDYVALDDFKNVSVREIYVCNIWICAGVIAVFCHSLVCEFSKQIGFKKYPHLRKNTVVSRCEKLDESNFYYYFDKHQNFRLQRNPSNSNSEGKQRTVRVSEVD